ncbi:MAG: ATP-binding cassette domain-containing protein [candidate division Zixibacteria bacterium]|nr:ATP-binding cassette domain-containing protein [candidate division Zixibacteria bacterium]
MTKTNGSIIQVSGLKKYFPIGRTLLGKPKNFAHAVDDVSFTIKQGETLGLVGESGSGKTTIGRLLVRLEKPTAGSMLFEGKDISLLKKRELKPFRGGIQMVFQDPYSSLNPRMKAGDLVSEPFIIYRKGNRVEIKEKVEKLFDAVGLRKEQIDRYSHEFSGGQRQRIGIARALALNPRLIIADEPVSALDVSVQAQVLNLLAELQDEFDLSFLFIAHDISVVAHVSHRIAVMYLGKLMEVAETKELIRHPRHPYTESLMNAVPIPNPKLRRDKHDVPQGDIPSPINPPSGCRFRTRCPHAFDRCAKEIPLLREIESKHAVACHLFDKEMEDA